MCPDDTFSQGTFQVCLNSLTDWHSVFSFEVLLSRFWNDLFYHPKRHLSGNEQVQAEAFQRNLLELSPDLEPNTAVSCMESYQAALRGKECVAHRALAKS